MTKLKQAACGIDCSECCQYKITMENDMKAAEMLVEWFKSQEWIGENESAEAVMNKAPLCKGCWNKRATAFGNVAAEALISAYVVKKSI